jgi:hypothetical protein
MVVTVGAVAVNYATYNYYIGQRRDRKALFSAFKAACARLFY